MTQASTHALQGKEAADDEHARHALRACLPRQHGATLTRLPTRTLGAKEAAAEHAREKLQACLLVSSESYPVYVCVCVYVCVRACVRVYSNIVMIVLA